MQKLISFISEHAGDDLTKLLLNRHRWPEIDVALAADCILSRRKLRGKVERWASDPELICPLPLSAEQCSSDGTAAYKAALAEHIALEGRLPDDERGNSWSIADLTGGLGIDSWYFSRKASEVLYNEMQPVLARAAAHNFKVLGADNIKVSNRAVVPTISLARLQEDKGGSWASPSMLLDGFHPDLIFMDPARRGEGGRKNFLLEDCTPDVLGLMDELWPCTEHILLKLSPMADITMVADRLGSACREIHEVSAGGECKELLVWLDGRRLIRANEAADEVPCGYELVICESGETLRCPASAEKSAVPTIASAELLEMLEKGELSGWKLFEPGKSLMKAGLFNYLSAHFKLLKAGRSTHYYLVPATVGPTVTESLKGLGKLLPIREVVAFNKRNLKDLASRFPHCEVTARNLPLSSDELRKKMKVASGDDAHIYALKTDTAGNLLFVC